MKQTKEFINLLPNSVSAQSFSNDFIILSSLIIVSFTIFIVGINQQLIKNNLQKHLKDKQSINQNRSKEINNISTRLKAIESQNQFQKKMNKFSKIKTNWAEYFKEISLITPKNIWIDKMTFKNANAKIELLLKGKTVSQMKVTNFFERLTKSNYYKNILINYSQIEKEYYPVRVKFEFATSGFFHFGKGKK